MIRIRNFYSFMYRQHIIWLRKWEVIVGGHDWSYWDWWILGGRGFVGVQRRSCRKYDCASWWYKTAQEFLVWLVTAYLIISCLTISWNNDEEDSKTLRVTGPCLNTKTVFPGMDICIIDIRRSWDHLIFINEKPFTGKMTYLYWVAPIIPKQ